MRFSHKSEKCIFAAVSSPIIYMKEVFYVFIGGGAGSVLRHLVSVGVGNRMTTPGLFPWATLSVNLAGSLLIGIFYSLSTQMNLSQESRLLLTVGLCGGFTTFSTFSAEGLHLLREGFYVTFSLYALLSLAGGLLAVMAGTYIAK